MKNLATKNTTDFTITENGDALISQRKTAELCGVERNSIVHFFKDKSDISQGVSDNQLASVVQYYANKGRAQAVQTLILFAKAGAKAYIYHEAGYKLKAEKQLPQNFSEALRLAADLQDKNEALEAQKALDAPKVQFAETITESSNTRCVRVWVKGMKSDHGLRVGERKVFRWLREKGYIFKDGALGNLPCSKYESNGLSYFSLAAVEDKCGVVRQSLQVTGKGMVALTQKVIQHFSDSMEVA